MTGNGGPNAQPIDFVHIYLTPSMGVGQRLSLDTIKRRLNTMPLRPVVELLSQVAARADLVVRDRAAGAELAANLFPRTVQPRAKAALRDPRVVAVGSHVVASLTLLALVHCKPDGEDVDNDVLIRQLGALILGLADHVTADEDDTREQALTLNLCRISLFYRDKDLARWLLFADRLLFRILPNLRSHPDYIDFDAVCRAHFGLPLGRLWALTAIYGSVAAVDPNGYVVPTALPDALARASDVRLWAEVWMTDLADAAARAAVDVESGWWSFTAFYDYPVIRLAPGIGVAPRPAFLTWKATPAGMFWLLARGWREAGGDHEKVARLFGAATEQLGRDLLAEALPRATRVDEDAIPNRWGDGPRCDTVLLDADWVAIDFVHRQMSYATTATGTFEDLTVDLDRAAVSKFRQIDATLARALNNEPPPTRIFALVVIGARYPSSPLVHDYVVTQVAEQSTVIGHDSRCRPPQVVDMTEFAQLLDVARVNEVSVAEVLGRWADSSMRGDCFRNWLATDRLDLKLPTTDTGLLDRWIELLQAD